MTIRISWLCLCLLLVSFQSAHTEEKAVSSDLCGDVPKTIRLVGEVRGLLPRFDVRCETKGRPEIEAFVKQEVLRRALPQQLRYEEIALKAVGLLPDEYPYTEGLIKLYAVQLGGYYDPEVDSLVLANWVPEGLQRMVAVHELAHALQDQHFDLERIVGPHIAITDEALARLALVEGDAILTSEDVIRRERGSPSLQAQGAPTVASIDQMVVNSDKPFEVESSIALQKLVTFPYQYGGPFAYTLLRRGGYRILDGAYRELPVTTREILHPEVYPIQEQRKTLSAAPTANPLFSDRLGEFVVNLLLQEGRVPGVVAQKIASGWRWDSLTLTSDEKGRYEVAWETVWDSSVGATSFKDAYQGAMKERDLRKKSSTDSKQFELTAWEISQSNERIVARFSVHSEQTP